MDFFMLFAESVIIAFAIGAVAGATVALHLQRRGEKRAAHDTAPIVKHR